MQRRGQDIAGLVQHLEQQPETAALAAVVQARVLLAQQKIAAAREVLEKAAAQAPASQWLRLLLSEVLMREGKDLGLAEQQLQAILAVDPQQATARQRIGEVQGLTKSQLSREINAPT